MKKVTFKINQKTTNSNAIKGLWFYFSLSNNTEAENEYVALNIFKIAKNV